jgi:acyl carrier protein
MAFRRATVAWSKKRRREEAAMSEVRDHVLGLIAEVLCMDAGEIDEGALLSDYGLNSIDMIDVVVKIEEKYKIRLDPNKMRGLTGRRLIDNVEALVPAGH